MFDALKNLGGLGEMMRKAKEMQAKFQEELGPPWLRSVPGAPLASR